MRFGIRELLYLLVLVGVMVGAYFVVLKPMDADIEKYRADTATKAATLAELQAAKSKYPDFDAETQRLRDAHDAFEQRLPYARDVEIILRDIWQIAEEESLKAKSVVPDKPIKAAQYNELPIKIEIEGNFDGYYSFIKRIEELPRITKMPRIKISKVSKHTTGDVKTELRLSIFFRSDNETPKA